MSKDVIMSIQPKWVEKIYNNEKQYEVRKQAPLQCAPYKIYIYLTKKGIDLWLTNSLVKRYPMNGNIIGEFICNKLIDVRPPFKGKESGTCLTARELYEYMGTSDHLNFIEIKDLVLYDVPKKLEDFGLSRPPQSWCYVKDGLNE